MAIPIKIQFTIQDAKGAVSRTLVHVPDATTLANATVYAQSVAALIENLILGRIIGVDICVGVAFTPAVGRPLAASDVEEGGMFAYQDADGRSFRMVLPSFSETFVTAGTRTIDQSNAAVQAYRDAIVLGLLTVQPVTLANTDITLLRSAKEQFSKNRKVRSL